MTGQNAHISTNQNPGIETRSEIWSQPESWLGASDAIRNNASRLALFFSMDPARPIALLGCGSPYYMNLSSAAAYRALAGRWAVALPASEVLYNLTAAIPANVTPLVIAVSRSGETSELIAACRKLKKERGSPLIAISVSQGTTLEKLVDFHVFIPDAGEKSVAQTRSFSAMLMASLGAVSIASHRKALTDELSQLPAQASNYIGRIQSPLAELIGRGFERVFFLGSGMRYGLANEGSLKMKEMSITDAEPFHFMEFRHGPQSMVDSNTLIVGLLSQHASDAETQVLHDMVRLGGTVLALGAASPSVEDRYVSIALPSGLSELGTLPFYMPALQMLAYNQAVRKGINCDSPRNLHAWIKLPNLDA